MKLKSMRSYEALLTSNWILQGPVYDLNYLVRKIRLEVRLFTKQNLHALTENISAQVTL